MGPRLHPVRRGPLPVRHAAAPVPDVRGPVGSRPAIARGGPARSVRTAAAEGDQEGEGARYQDRPRYVVRGSDARNGQAPHAVRLADGRAARSGGRGGHVSPVRGPGEGSGHEGEVHGGARGGIPGGGDRREGELYGAGLEGGGRGRVATDTGEARGPSGVDAGAARRRVS